MWCSNTIKLDIERPMAWAVALVACKARSVMLLRSLSETESRPASSLASILASKKTGRHGGAESLSEKKAIRESREARLKLSQWEQSQSVPLSAASAWDFSKHYTYSAWESFACRGDLHVLQWRRGICNNTVKFALLVRLFGSMPVVAEGWPSLQSGCCERS